MNNWSKIPFFRVTLFFCIGIVIGYKYVYPTLCFYLSLTTFALYVCTFFVTNKNKFYFRWIEGILIALFLLSAGACCESDKRAKLWIPWSCPEKRNYQAEIIDQPEERNATIKCPVELRGKDVPKGSKMILYIAKDDKSSALKDGDKILLTEVTFRPPQKEKNSSFDYQKYLEFQGYSGSQYISKTQWVKGDGETTFSLLRLSRQLRTKIIETLRGDYIKGDELGVVSALVFGDKSMLSKEIEEEYSATGTSHILAVSGLHVGLVYMLFTLLFKWVIRPMKWKKLRICLSLIFLWIYTFITGLPASVVRASVMLTLAMLSELFNRRSSLYNTLFASAFVMLWYNPNYLFDVGFQLSYLALLSILIFQKTIYETFRFRLLADKAWALLSVTLAAQVATLPLILYCFHQFSNYFLLSNLVVVPLSTFITYLTFALLILNKIPMISDLLAYIVGKLIYIMNKMIEWMSNLPFSTINNIDFKAIDLIFLYLFVLLMTRVLNEKKFKNWVGILIVLFVYTLYRATYQFFL